MTGEKANFLSLAATHRGSVIFGNEKSCKNPQEGSGPEPDSKEEGHGDKQVGGTIVEPCLKQNLNSNPETGIRNRHQKQDPELFLNQDHQPIRLNSEQSLRTRSD